MARDGIHRREQYLQRRGQPCQAVVPQRPCPRPPVDGVAHRLRVEDPLAAAESVVAGAGRLTAPMPGKIVEVAVKLGDAVKRGAPLMVLEAMKMEHTIAAPADGIVGELLYAAGDLVEEGAELLLLDVTV